MHIVQIQLSENAFSQAELVATNSGFVNADSYLGDLLERSLRNPEQAFFTSEVVAELDAAAEEALTGKNLSLEESKAEIAELSEQWQANQLS